MDIQTVIFLLIAILVIYYISRSGQIIGKQPAPQPRSESFTPSDQPSNFIEPVASTFSSPLNRTPVNAYNTPLDNTPEYLENSEYYVPIAYQSFDEINANRMANMQMKNKRAIDGTVRNTANNFAKYFQEELDYNENRDWYSQSADDMSTDMLDT